MSKAKEINECELTIRGYSLITKKHGIEYQIGCNSLNAAKRLLSHLSGYDKKYIGFLIKNKYMMMAD